MSMAEACGVSVLRSVMVAAGSLLVAVFTAAYFRHRRRRAAWWLLPLPFLMPKLMIGYAYADFSLSLIHHPLLNQCFFILLTGLCAVPAGTAVLLIAPPSPLSASAVHCRRLQLATPASSFVANLKLAALRLRANGKTLTVAFAVLFLVSFQEFEMAWLMQIRTWTVWLMDSWTRGLTSQVALQSGFLPVLCELAVVVPGLMIATAIPRHQLNHQEHTPASGVREVGVRVYLLFAVTVTVVIPFALTGHSLVPGFRGLIDQAELLRGTVWEILVGVGFGAAAAATVCWFLNRFPLVSSRGFVGPGMLVALCLPGLLGSLIMGIALVAAFQSPVLHRFYDTPGPQWLGLCLFLFPRAVLLHALLNRVRPSQSVYLSELVARSPDVRQQRQGQRLLWQLRHRSNWLVVLLLTWWGYWNVILAVLLGPSRLVCAPVRLYNDMHYGRLDVLSARTALAILLPVLLLLAVTPLWRRYLHWRMR